METAMKMTGAMLGIVLGLGGLSCTTVKAPIEARWDPHESKQIMIADPKLSKQTAVGAPEVTRDQAGIMYVTVPIRAATDRQLYVDYRVTFLDQSGQLLSQSSWMSKTLAPNVPDRVQANSMTPRAANFQMDFRWSK
jgi:hypothetical protein